jgi:hypothetical protein
MITTGRIIYIDWHNGSRNEASHYKDYDIFTKPGYWGQTLVQPTRNNGGRDPVTGQLVDPVAWPAAGRYVKQTGLGDVAYRMPVSAFPGSPRFYFPPDAATATAMQLLAASGLQRARLVVEHINGRVGNW